jgi:hypothetical protein
MPEAFEVDGQSPEVYPHRGKPFAASRQFDAALVSADEMLVRRADFGGLSGRRRHGY